MTNIPKFRTVKEVVKDIKSMDTKTAITENFIRYLVKENKIKYIKSGKKVLINLNVLLEYLNSDNIFEDFNNEEPKNENKHDYINKIRKLA